MASILKSRIDEFYHRSLRRIGVGSMSGEGFERAYAEDMLSVTNILYMMEEEIRKLKEKIDDSHSG